MREARMHDGILSFPHDWSAKVLERPPLIAPARQYVYPQQVEDVERGALLVKIRPANGPEFVATFALGFADPAVPTGVWSCPDPGWICVVSGGYAYLVDVLHPERWQQVAYRPVLAVVAVPVLQLLLFAGHHSMLAWGREGQVWQSARLSSEGVSIVSIEGATLTGRGWDLLTDKEYDFQLDLRTGQRLS